MGQHKRLTRRQAGKVSIALIVSIALACVITLVLGTFALLFYQGERDARMAELRADLAANADQLAVAVALPAWNFDETQILAIMKSGLNNRDLHANLVDASANKRQYVLERDAGGAQRQVTQVPNSAELLLEKRPIVVAGQQIGSVSVYATPRYVLEDLRQRRLAIVGVIVVLDLTLVLAVYLLMWQLMLKPISAIGQFAARVGAGDTGAVSKDALFLGELGTLHGSIRAMVELLASRFRAMRESEERLKIATRAASIGIWDWDLVSGQVVWDDQMYRMFGVGREVEGGPARVFAQAVLEQDRHLAGGAIDEALRGGREFESEFRIRRADGALRHLRADSLTFRDPSGRPLRMVGVYYDITERKMAEQELTRHRSHLEELVAERTTALSVAVAEANAANRAKSVFLATMSHELRTPLNSVIGFSRLMADSGSMLPEEKRNLAIIHRSGQHLLTLINDILELSKIEAGRIQLHVEPCRLPDLLREVVDMVSARARQTGVTLTLHCKGVPETVLVDGAKLRQVLLNLLSNAVKFAEHGQVDLEVDGALGFGRQCLLGFGVRDNGVGIASADQERIFEPFIQAENGRNRDGTGLGLSISREFVSLLGGQLRLESAPGQGALFRFAIPVMLGDEPVAASDVLAPLQVEGGRRILVVDDNGDGRRLMQGILAPMGFVVSEAADGAAALVAIAREAPELVFMDWRMPGMDGLEATRCVRADSTLVQPRIVMLTASAFEEERQQALSAGADDFLRKPIEQQRLYEVLEQQLGMQFVRVARAAAAPERSLSEDDLAPLDRALRAALRTALQELNMALVEQLLASLDGPTSAALRAMLARHQYRQICALLDAVDTKENA